MTQGLVKSPGINVKEEDEQKLTPLHMACVFGYYSCARLVYRLLLHNVYVILSKDSYSYSEKEVRIKSETFKSGLIVRS